MSNPSNATIQSNGDAGSHDALSLVEREEVVMRYWRHGNLTPLGVANSLVRQGSRVQFASGEAQAVRAAASRERVLHDA